METQNEESVLRTKRCLFAVTEEEEQERRLREAEEDGKPCWLELGCGGSAGVVRLPTDAEVLGLIPGVD